MGGETGELRERIEAIESCYEFMLAYAAQGLRSDQESPLRGQLRELLSRAARAMDGLADAFRREAAALANGAAAADGGAEGLRQPQRDEGPMGDFAAVLERDTRASLAAVRLVLAQPSISSQLIDNLNALIHLRALLTDLFLIDELLAASAPAPGSSAADRRAV